MKRILLAMALTFPIGYLLDVLTYLAYGNETSIIVRVLGFATGAGLFWVGYIAADKILKAQKLNRDEK